MALIRRVLVLLMASLLSCFAVASPARASGTEATKAADFIVSTFKSTGDTRFGEVGSAADSLLALASTGDARYDAQIADILAVLQGEAAAFVKPDASGVSGAAKLALAAVAAHADPRSFGGVDLVTIIEGGIGADGSFGAFPGPFSSGLAMVALSRSGASVPDSMVDYLLTYAEPRTGTTGGGFGCATYPFKKGSACSAADPDSTAMAVLGLQASGSTKAKAAATDALAWLASTQQADGSWLNFSPVNSTGVVGPLFAAGSEQATRATAYVISKQLASGALSTGLDNKANLLATQQGIFALTGQTYATIGLSTATPTATAAPESSATAAPETSAPAAPATPSGTDPAVMWTVGALLLPLLGGAAAASRSRR